MKLTVLVSCLLGLLIGCQQPEPTQSSSSSTKQDNKWLNPKIHKRFSLLSNDPAENRLIEASPLEFIDGVERQLSKCSEIERTNIEQLVEREQELLMAAKIDCQIARRFIVAKAATTSFLPAQLDKDTLLSLPAGLLPTLNSKTSTQSPDDNLSALNISRIEMVQERVHQIAVNDVMLIKITEVARADFNADGVEDLMLITEWGVTDSGDGTGIDLMIIEDLGDRRKLIWQFSDIISSL